MDISLFTNPKEPQFSYTFFCPNNNGDHVALDMHSKNNQQLPQHSHTSTSRSSAESAGGVAAEHTADPYGDAAGDKWASNLLKECARAISDKDSSKIHHLLWMLNELASPYGDCNQKLASYFLQALFCKATESGQRCYKTLTAVTEKNHSFDSARKLILQFQEVSPWTTFGHVASNGAILEALEGETKLHIIDISNTLCTQWPTLLEALATRNDETPHLKLTVVVTETLVRSVMKEIGQRMAKFARLMGVPFEFNAISGLNHIAELTKETLGVKDDEAVAVNCIGAMRRVAIDERELVIQMFHSLGPKIVTIVEEEADFTSSKYDFVWCFEECLRFYTLYFEMLQESFPMTSNERLTLERECSRNIVRVLACEEDENYEEECERRERGRQWSEKFMANNFSPSGFSDDVVDDVKALLKRYKAGWALVTLPQQQGADNNSTNNDNHHENAGIYLTWKEEPVVWASAWKP
ncbi:protein SHORT-ROOT-like [Mangifera indica]|uniref:protein SHORT-ROOT-like n=1 Tax=Mangifera indica TaxID=29780 RepID=UPI001CFC3F69|nr:protein SHORT-ROOT-like [Mangifera indica]